MEKQKCPKCEQEAKNSFEEDFIFTVGRCPTCDEQYLDHQNNN